MAQKLNFLARNCLVWTTERPCTDLPRRSPSFSVAGVHCYLSLTFAIRDGPSYCYFVNIYEKQSGRTLMNDCEIFISLMHSEKVISSQFINLKYGNNLIYLPDTDKQYRATISGLWRVFCTFVTDLPVQLDVDSSETMCLSNLSDLTWNSQQNSTKSDVFMKAKLAACASYDVLSGLEILSFDLNKLLEQKSSSDVTLKCGGVTFSAHRTILAARSEIFAAMFKNKMVESETGIIDITDIDGKVLDLLLKYVYTGKVPDLSLETASALYLSADKYAIHNLKIDCAKWMLANLTKENCLEYLLLADSCSDKRFKEGLITFIAQILDMIDEQAWLKFGEDHSNLAVCVYRSVMYQKKA